MFDHLINLTFSSSKSAEKVNRTIFSNLHWSWDFRSTNLSRFLFFEISRIVGQNCYEGCLFVIWCSIIWSIWLSVIGNEQTRWTELWWEMFIWHVMFDQLIHRAFSSSKWAELVKKTVLRNVHLLCDVRSSDQSGCLLLEVRRIGEQNYDVKSSFVSWCSMIWSISRSLVGNQQKRWIDLWWEIFVCHMMFEHLINLAFTSSKSAEYVYRTMMRIPHWLCDDRSSDPSRFLFFEMSRIGEQYYDEKSPFAMWCWIIWWI
jgi:hypothetical protein